MDDDEDEFDTDHDEASRGLLSGTHGPSYSVRYLEPVGVGSDRHMSECTFRLILSLEVSSSMANTVFCQTLESLRGIH